MTLPYYQWSTKNIKEARTLLKLRYDDSPFNSASVQEMTDLLIQEFRCDPKEIERAISNHFKHKNNSH